MNKRPNVPQGTTENNVSRGGSAGGYQQRGAQRQQGGNEPHINENITSRTVQLISATGQNLGVFARDDAIRMAREANLDLVVLAEKEGEAPVTKIMDYGKALYAKKKQQTTAKKNQKVIQVKEIQISHKIGQHDLDTKLNKGREFLAEGKHVKIVVTFYGRINLAEYSTMRDQRGNELFTYIDQVFGVGTGKVTHEKDAKTRTLWTRIYFNK